MGARFDVAVLVGSLRKASFTRKAARALIASSPASFNATIVEIGDLPLYNEDLEGQIAPWERFRKEVAGVHAVLFTTPEYNRSIPGCLKNAVDVGSRPSGKSVWDGKPAAVVSVTPYKLGAFGANQHLRQSFVFLNMPAMQQPEAYISGAGDLFGEDGSLKNEETKQFFTKFMSSFEHWISRFSDGRSE
jgi:chromate reductase